MISPDEPSGEPVNEGPDNWIACWEEQGTRLDDGRAVLIRVGVLSAGDNLSIALRVASGPLVTLVGRSAAGLGELMRWALDERDMLLDLQEQKRTEGMKMVLDRAVLTRRQWRSMADALRGHGGAARHPVMDLLRRCAPPAWVEEFDTDPR